MPFLRGAALVVGAFLTIDTPALAADINTISEISINLKHSFKSTYFFSTGPKTNILYNDNVIRLEKVRIDGETFWSVSGMPAANCSVDSRFSFVNPLFKVGRGHVENIRCSAPATREAGTMVAQARGDLSGGVLTVNSKITGDVEVLGVRTKSTRSMSLKIDIKDVCRVVSVSVIIEERSHVNHQDWSVASFDEKCSMR